MTMPLSIYSFPPGVKRRVAAMADSSRRKDGSSTGRRARPPAVPSLIRDALGRSPLGVYEVAALLPELLGVPVTKEHLDSWSSDSPFPLRYAAAFCRATGDTSLIRYLIEQQNSSSAAQQ
jgi:hypothetical protein